MKSPKIVASSSLTPHDRKALRQRVYVIGAFFYSYSYFLFLAPYQEEE